MGVNFPHPKFIIECAGGAIDQLSQHLKRYILRSKVKVRDVSSDYTIWSIWGPSTAHIRSVTHKDHPHHDKQPTGSLVKKEGRVSDIGCVDPRVPNFGLRVVAKRDEREFFELLLCSEVPVNVVEIALALPTSFSELPSTEYTIRRILHGIPEGLDDLWSGQSLPLESNFDYMNGGMRDYQFCSTRRTIMRFHDY